MRLNAVGGNLFNIMKMKIYGEGYRVKFKPSEEQLKSAFEFGKNFGKCVLEGKIVDWIYVYVIF